MQKKGFSNCEICNGAGWLREDLDVNDEDFGRLIPCECNLEELARIEAELTALEENKPPGPDLRWADYTE